MSQQTLSLSAIDDPIPVQSSPQEQALAALKEAVHTIAALLKANGVNEEDIIADFQAARRREMAAQTVALDLDTL